MRTQASSNANVYLQQTVLMILYSSVFRCRERNPLFQLKGHALNESKTQGTKLEPELPQVCYFVCLKRFVIKPLPFTTLSCHRLRHTAQPRALNPHPSRLAEHKLQISLPGPFISESQYTRMFKSDKTETAMPHFTAVETERSRIWDYRCDHTPPAAHSLQINSPLSPPSLHHL